MLDKVSLPFLLQIAFFIQFLAELPHVPNTPKSDQTQWQFRRSGDAGEGLADVREQFAVCSDFRG